MIWLRARTPAPPEPLLTRMGSALRETGPGLPLPAALAAAALPRLQAAIALGDARAAAYDLLAADALLSYAFEAAAELGLESVSAVAETYGPARIAPLIATEE